MKYQNISSDENRHFVFSEDTIFIFDCEDIKVVITASVNNTGSLPLSFFIHKSVTLKNKMEFSNQLPNFEKKIISTTSKTKGFMICCNDGGKYHHK